MINRAAADQAALAVWRCATSVLRRSAENDTLRAFAWSGNSIEKWLVYETYAELWRRWDGIVGENTHWNGWMEAVLPGQTDPRKHIDLILGESERMLPPKQKYYQPKAWTPAFEFKVLRDDDFPDGRKSINQDAAKLTAAGLRNKYEIVAFRSTGRMDFDALRRGLLLAVPDLMSLAPAHGPEEAKIDQPNLAPVIVDLHIEAFRVTR